MLLGIEAQAAVEAVGDRVVGCLQQPHRLEAATFGMFQGGLHDHSAQAFSLMFDPNGHRAYAGNVASLVDEIHSQRLPALNGHEGREPL
ncbi:MAG: hypothetical protein AMJ77_02925 [Dehalococcoidia bacterium SM23_28_2]|nr:MAG: hypothetical protein AMJ77_02925 [Dehalococcoidia bacterium SM23_28_2]